jgi:hypothetical protein
MNFWERFLKSLETDGGKICVIIFMLMFIVSVAAALTFSGHPLQEVGRELATGAVGALLGHLYGYLRPSSK